MSLSGLKLIVFDLDYTLWPFWVDTHVTPPFRKTSSDKIVDAYGGEIKCYPEVPKVLKNLYDQGYALGIASRTGEIKGARQLIELFGWDKYFKYKQIFPGCKITHFENLKKETGYSFEEMIFFDDEQRNIRDLEGIGVVSIFVKNGVNEKLVNEGLEKFKSKK